MKKFAALHRQRFVKYFFRGFLFLMVSLLYGCNSGSSSVQAIGSVETGSVSFSIEWQDTAEVSALDLAKAQSVNCTLIEHIVCEVYDASGNDLTTATFECIAGQGTVDNIPVGSDIRCVILCLDASGEIQARAQINNITISANQTNDLGTITVTPFLVSTLLSPENDSTVSADELSFRWQAVQYASEYYILVSTDKDFDEVVINVSTEGPAFTPSSPLAFGTYYWMVLPIDAYLNQGAASPVWSFSVISDVECNYSILPATNSFSSDGGAGSITVTASAEDCTWSATSSADWATITLVASASGPFGTSGTGSGTVAYTVSANTSEEEREATITISDESHTITQEGLTMPDLVITTGSPTVTPAAVAPGESVTVDGWTVQNQGTADAGAFYIGYYLSQDAAINTWDTNLLSISSSGLSIGEEYDVNDQDLTIPQNIESGTYYIGILVDHTNAVSEFDEDNNYVSRQITVSSSVDLVITTGSPTVTPSEVVTGEIVTLSGWTVENQGTTSSGEFSNGFYLSTDSVIDTSDWYLAGNSNASLAPGTSFTWGETDMPIPTDINTGWYYIGILVDRTGAVSESNESNNYVSQTIYVFELPVFIVE